MNVTIAIGILTVLAVFAGATNYCRKDLCRGAKHIGCKNPNIFGPSCPKNTKFHDLSKFKDAIVNRHNNYRNLAASGLKGRFPSASRMATMVWDNELAYLAGLNVKTCIHEHNQCHNTGNFKFSGQNLAYKSSSEQLDLLEASLRNVDSWFGEYKDTTVENLKQFGPSKHKIGHFTVMVTDRNYAVGCAAVKFMKPEISNGWTFNMTTVMVACNYASTNMMSGAGLRAIPVYEFGKPTSECKTGLNPVFPNLCSEKEFYDVKSFKRYYV